MCWTNIENQCKIIYEKPFINAEKPHERRFIIQIIAEEFPDFPRVRIAAAVDRCFKIFPVARREKRQYVLNKELFILCQLFPINVIARERHFLCFPKTVFSQFIHFPDVVS